MEASTIERPVEEEPVKGAVEQESDAAKTPSELFRYSAVLHVGVGAQECEDPVACSDDAHFHAYVRLPNQFQHSDIRQRAMASKARRLRLLRDPDSDSSAIMDVEMEQLEREGDKATLVDELVNQDWWKDHLEAIRLLSEDEAWEHIDQDRDRLREIEAMEADKRPVEEHEEIIRHIDAYATAVEKHRTDLQTPRRDALMAMEMSELVKQVRSERVDAEATAAFMETYSKWEWYAGTLKLVATGKPKERVFSSIEDLEAADIAVLEALRETYGELEAAFQRGPAGNS